MEVAKRFGNSSNSQNWHLNANLNQTQLITLLALPEGEEENFLALKAPNNVLIFAIIRCFITCRIKNQSFCPIYRLAHYFNDFIETANAFRHFTNNFVVYMHNDFVTGIVNVRHCNSKEIAGDSLNDIFRQTKNRQRFQNECL